MNNNNISFNEISNAFFDFLEYKHNNINDNDIFQPSLIYQLLDEEPLLNKNTNITAQINVTHTEPENKNITNYNNHLIEIMEQEFKNINNSSSNQNFPLLINFENPFQFFEKGLPNKPYYKTISYVIYNWNKIHHFPYTFVDHDMPNEIEEYTLT